MTSQLAISAIGFFAVAVGFFTWIILNLQSTNIATSSIANTLEDERRNTLRETNSIYRHFELLIDELVAVNSLFFDDRQIQAMETALRALSPGARWKPLEYVAVKELEAIATGSVFAVICLFRLSFVVSIAIGGFIAGYYLYSALQGLKLRAAARVKMLRRRLPFAVDLMALMLEAGAGFLESLKTVVRENKSHPLGEELGVVVAQVEMGRTRRQALEGFRDRLQDQDITDLVSAINKGEELGTPLSAIMRVQADQMRLKRSQWGEKAAAEAQVQMTFPSMLIMLACILLIVAPFALPLFLTRS